MPKVNNSKLKISKKPKVYKRIFSKSTYLKTVSFIQKRPLTSFFIVLLILFGLIAAGNLLTPKKQEQPKQTPIKEVQIFRVGASPVIQTQAKIEKSGIIKISALTPGIISSINVTEGQEVAKGTILINMASNYAGGNPASIQRQIAQAQYKNTKDTSETQKQAVMLQKELAQKTEANAIQLRDIAGKSLQETRDLITQNQVIVDKLASNLRSLEQANVGGVNDTLILQTRSQQAQLQGAITQLRFGLSNTEYQALTDAPPAQLAEWQRRLTLTQLEVQQKALDLGLEVSRLQLQLAQISEAAYFPTSPFPGKIQRIHVRVGQSVNPGTPLITLSAADDPITAVVNIPQNLAFSVSMVETSSLTFDDLSINLTPFFISTEATEGILYSVLYIIPDQYKTHLTDGEYIRINIPLGLVKTSNLYVPIDAVFQSSNESSVFIVKGENVESRKIGLGGVFGRFVEVKSGLSASDQIILNRNVLSGDKIKVTK